MGKIRRERYDDDRGEKYHEDRRSVKYEEDRRSVKYEEDRRSVKYEEDRRSEKYEANRHENYNLQRGVSYEEIHAREVLNSDNSDNENTASSTDDSESSSGSGDSRASNESVKRKRYKKRKEKIKKEKHYRGSVSAESDENEVEDQGRHRKRKKIRDEFEDGGNNVEDRRHRSRSRKRKHKHKRKHRRRRHYGSEERGSESQRDHGWGEGEREKRGRSLEDVDSRREEMSRPREDHRSDRRLEKERRRDKRENDRTSRKGDREDVRRERRENRRAEEQESRKRKKEYVWNPTSRWDDEEEPTVQDQPAAVQEEVLDDPSRFIPGRQRKKSKATVPNGGSSEPPVEKNSEVWGKPDDNVKEEPIPVEEKEKPSLGLSGKLTEDTNTYNGVVIKYSQPSEARKPKRRWRWYIFKGDDEMPFLPLHRQSAYLIGRDRKVVDIPSDHPSCSKQHSVLQYRLVSYTRIDGTKGRTVKPYILDLESANGTFLNNKRIDGRKYYELQERDVVKFGYSSREYVLLHEGSKDDEAEEDAGVPDLSPVSLLRQKE